MCLKPIVISGLAFALLTTSVRAVDILPYSSRNNAYSAWGTSIRGDLRTIGMAGAQVGLGSTLLGSLDNPASLAMTLKGVGIQFNSDRLFDGHLQNFGHRLSSSSFMASANAYPWGFSAGYWTPHLEGQPYEVTGTGTSIDTRVETREIRISAARLFFDKKLSVGLSFIIGENEQKLILPNTIDQSRKKTATALSFNAGIMYQLPRRWIIGANFSPGVRFQMDRTDPPSGITNFYQDARSPTRFALGVGWVPNRFFQGGFGIYYTSATPDVALLSDDSISVGTQATLQPRLGFTYKIVEFKELDIQISSGTYLEISRIENTGDRLHYTGGIEVKPWVLEFGWGVDTASNYENYIVSTGVNVVKLMRKLDLLPSEYHPPYAGWLPKSFRYSDSGLPRALVKRWRNRQKKINFLETAKKVPLKLQNRIKRTGEDFLDVFSKEKKKKKKKKKSRKKRRKKKRR